MEYFTSQKDFDFFCKCGRSYLKYYGLLDWDVDFVFNTDPEDQDDRLAYCFADLSGKAATIGLCVDWKQTKPTREQMDLSAYHEVCELLLSPLNILAKERFITESRIDEARHSVIRILENTHLVNLPFPKNVKR